jgi:hypothetical protein
MKVPSCNQCKTPALVYVHYKRTRHWAFVCSDHLNKNIEHVGSIHKLDSARSMEVIEEIKEFNPGRLV